MYNGNISIVSEELDISGESDTTKQYKAVTIHDLRMTLHDLRKLKHLHPGCCIKQADITPHATQNCDATSRVLQLPVLKDLEQYACVRAKWAGDNVYTSYTMCQVAL